MSSQYKYYDGKKNFKTQYIKSENDSTFSCPYECTCKFIKPRSKYDQLFVNNDKPITLPRLENKGWK